MLLFLLPEKVNSTLLRAFCLNKKYGKICYTGFVVRGVRKIPAQGDKLKFFLFLEPYAEYGALLETTAHSRSKNSRIRHIKATVCVCRVFAVRKNGKPRLLRVGLPTMAQNAQPFLLLLKTERSLHEI